jgi:hypothetical protein
MNAIPKSPGLIALVDRLRRDLGQGYFIEVPHWDSDRAAIGLGRPDDPRFLVYLAVQADNCEVYVECEIPARVTPTYLTTWQRQEITPITSRSLESSVLIWPADCPLCGTHESKFDWAYQCLFWWP